MPGLNLESYYGLVGADNHKETAHLTRIDHGPWKGRTLKIETFLGSEMASSAVSAIFAQKSQDFQGPPLPMARLTDLPPSKSVRPGQAL